MSKIEKQHGQTCRTRGHRRPSAFRVTVQQGCPAPVEKQGPESPAALCCSGGSRRPCRGGEGQQWAGPTCPRPCPRALLLCRPPSPTPALRLGPAKPWGLATETGLSSRVTLRGCPSRPCKQERPSGQRIAAHPPDPETPGAALPSQRGRLQEPPAASCGKATRLWI